MRFPIYSIAVPVLAIVGFAQDTPPAEPKKSVESTSPAKMPDKSSSQSADRLQEMKTQTYAGMLVDGSCAGAGTTAASAASSTSPAESSADRTATQTSGTGSARTATSSKQTSAAGNAGGCGLSAGASQFALQMKDGRTVRLDDVGNARVQEAMKNRKKWSESATANKPVRVKVSGVLNGDKLTVLSVN